MKQYIGMAEGTNQNSGYKATRAEVVAWATKKLAENVNIQKVLVLETVAAVVRQAMPIDVIEIEDMPASIAEAA